MNFSSEAYVVLRLTVIDSFIIWPIASVALSSEHQISDYHNFYCSIFCKFIVSSNSMHVSFTLGNVFRKRLHIVCDRLTAKKLTLSDLVVIRKKYVITFQLGTPHTVNPYTLSISDTLVAATH